MSTMTTTTAATETSTAMAAALLPFVQGLIAGYQVQEYDMDTS